MENIENNFFLHFKLLQQIFKLQGFRQGRRKRENKPMNDMTCDCELYLELL